MRTTVSLDDDVLDAARSLAAEQGIPLGKAISLLARRGLEPLGLRTSRAGVLVFDTPADFPPLTPGDVAAAVADFP